MNGEIVHINEEIVRDIEKVLDFVERWNKMDKEADVAQAAANIETYLATYQDDHE